MQPKHRPNGSFGLHLRERDGEREVTSFSENNFTQVIQPTSISSFSFLFVSCLLFPFPENIASERNSCD